MAGQKIYSTNVLSTARGAILITANVQVNGALNAVTGTRILNGRMSSVVAVSSVAGGTNNAVTLQLPERYGVLENVNIQVVPASATDGTIAKISTDYVATTGQITIALGTVTGATFTGSTSPNLKVYFGCEAAVGI